MERRDRPRVPGVVFASFALILIVLIGILSVTLRQTPPPTIAEFAPQAVESITDAAEDQAQGAGGATPSAAPDDAAVDATPTPLAIDVPRVRRCVGDPPRQI